MSRELKHETFAGISEELRSISRSATYCEIDQPKVFGKPIAFYFAELADRIDAAELALSNMAAMRETLRQIKQMGIDLRNIIPCLDKNWEQCLKAAIKIYQAAERALFEPPRNCDRFGGDPKMLHTAWFDWSGSPSGCNPDGTVKLTFGEWLLATEKKGGAM